MDSIWIYHVQIFLSTFQRNVLTLLTTSSDIVENRIIAMGFPSEGVEAKYRNAYTEVIKFLDLRHKDHFKVYNLFVFSI